MQLKNLKTLFIAVVVVFSFTACEDDFTDPNDPKFGGDNSGKGLIIDLDTKYQRMHHFGASDGWSSETLGENWPIEDREMIAELFFSKEFDSSGKPKGIGLSMWRVNVGAGSANMENSGFQASGWFRETECALQPDGSYDWENNQVGTRWFMKKAREYGVDYFTGWVTSAPYFMTKNGYTFCTPGTAGLNLQEDKYDDFAGYLHSFLNYHREAGLPIDYLSIINEPQWAWQAEVGESKQEGSYCSNEEAFNLTRAIHEVFEAEGQPTKMLLPEAGDLPVLHSYVANHAPTSDQVNVFWNPTSDLYLGNMNTVAPLVAGHSYWSNQTVETAIDNRKALLSKTNQLGVDFWQTEYSLLGTAYQEGRNPDSLKEIDYMLWLARIIHWDVTLANATGWNFWTACSASDWGDHRNRFGLIVWLSDVQSRSSSSGEIIVSRQLWTLGHFSRFIRPGYERIAIKNNLYTTEAKASRNLMASAYLSPDSKELVMVLINYGDKAETFGFENYGEDFEFINNEVTTYTSTNTKNMEPAVEPAEELTVSPKSIVTVVAKIK
ncbi:MAG: glycoside hydrolase [Marinoscillum sp.]|uniref:glycoside hydrolase n=1 Tax=Marinoscillum sp. TaxID=2024838 RepID=UPI0032FE247D